MVEFKIGMVMLGGVGGSWGSLIQVCLPTAGTSQQPHPKGALTRHETAQTLVNGLQSQPATVKRNQTVFRDHKYVVWMLYRGRGADRSGECVGETRWVGIRTSIRSQALTLRENSQSHRNSTIHGRHPVSSAKRSHSLTRACLVSVDRSCRDFRCCPGRASHCNPIAVGQAAGNISKS